MNFFTHIARVALAASVLAASSFAATVANGSFGFNSTGGLVTYSPGSGSLLNAKTVSIPTPSAGPGSCGVAGFVCEQITSIAPTYLGLQNDFATGGNTPLNINDDVRFTSYTFDLTFATLPTFFFTLQNSSRFTFTATSASSSTATLGNSDFLNVGYTGTFTDSLGFYSPATASLSLSFNQTGGSTGNVTYSGTFATPPAPTTGAPEPASMVLFGSALVGIGIFRRKRADRS
jgi:PEP-CTERM motif